MTANPPVDREYLQGWGLHATSSPLYHHLVTVIAGDDELLRVINRIPNRPPPNLLFGAVHFLMLGGVDHPLKQFYASLVPSASPPSGADIAFRDFVLDREEEIVGIGEERFTQTNECRRCVALLPGVMEAGLGSFHLIEIGASAGLNLGLDRYSYSWSDLRWGPESPVRLEAESRGESPSLRDIEILSRVGLDLNPINPSDADDRRWLEALIWPEHEERRHRLRAALELVQNLEVTLIAGDAVTTLEGVIAGLASGEPAVIMDSFSLNQFTDESREELDRIVQQARGVRRVGRVSLEPRRDDASASLRVDDGSGWRDLGRCQHHGEWLELYARP